MPTVSGQPVPPGYIGALNPVPWNDMDGDGSLDRGMAMRGKPMPLEHWQERAYRQPATPQPQPFWLQSRPYDRGAGAYAPQFGRVLANVIGAGVYAPYRLPTIAGPGARYVFGAIWFDVQSVPTSMYFSPNMSQQSVDALLRTSHVAAMYPTTG